MTTFASCFSGLEGASLAVEPLGWECVGVAEIEPFPAAIIAQRFPQVENLGDVLADDFLDRIAALQPDVLMGGPPCQDFSVAGLRAGLDGHRGNLSLRWVQIIHAARPIVALTENVPGWLSVNGGHAFGAFLAGLVGFDSDLLPPANCGGRWTDSGMVAGPKGRAAWRILDAQFFGLAQRRERVFVVASFRDGPDPAKILFEPARLQGNFAPRREAGERPAGNASEGAGSGFGGGHCADIAPTLNAGFGDKLGLENQHIDGGAGLFIAHSLRAEGFDASEDGTGRGTPLVPVAFNWQGGGTQTALGFNPDSGITSTLQAEQVPAVAFDLRGREGGAQFEGPHETANIRAASGGSSRSYVAQQWAVRRLTPNECESLQGVPDGHTKIAWRGKPASKCPDGPRYRALGNSWAIPVVRWIASRVDRAIAARMEAA